ncbi:hypothetical protein HM1_2658 [Heliomicrobium modesticaldum Ice1]|uniref:Uncharacterized protein n=1 Tax=Heliobacterium modesticaldum (strain ATCC 51547 / Ice1) TaxID=498761 RepID=B0TBH4_HELMI|nr:hypothetical protein HM1_2658 [Heliomicrobium modesticaldum Ice1]
MQQKEVEKTRRKRIDRFISGVSQLSSKKSENFLNTEFL